MVGPFLQGILLMGVIYFYSKGIMSMINDYYRSEFQRKLQVAEDRQQNASSLAYDVDENIVNLINVDSFMTAEDKSTGMTSAADVCPKRSDLHAFLEMMRVLEPRPDKQFCWLDKATGNEILQLID